jgi:hypothetical protein
MGGELRKDVTLAGFLDEFVGILIIFSFQLLQEFLALLKGSDGGGHVCHVLQESAVFSFSGVNEVLKGVGAGDQFVIGIVQRGLTSGNGGVQEVDVIVVLNDLGGGIIDVGLQLGVLGIALTRFLVPFGISSFLGVIFVFEHLVQDHQDALNGVFAVGLGSQLQRLQEGFTEFGSSDRFQELDVLGFGVGGSTEILADEEGDEEDAQRGSH